MDPMKSTYGRRSARALLLLLAGVVLILTHGPQTALAVPGVAVLTTDFSTGSISYLPAIPPWNPETGLAPACGDAAARVYQGLLYVINRRGCDNIEVINPVDGWSVLREFSVGAGTNPQDIAFVSPHRAYVSRYETNILLEVDPSTGEELGTISLQSLADEDGLCEMHRMEVVGSFLYVQVQRMIRNPWPDPWVPAPPSYLAVINLNTRLLMDVDGGTPGVQGIALAGANPIAPMQLERSSGRLLVPTAGVYGTVDAAGIERVNVVTWRTEGFVIEESDLGGDLIDFAQWTTSRGFALVSEPGFQIALVSYNPLTAQRTGTLYSPGGYTLSDLLVAGGGYLFLSDRDFFEPGVRIFDAQSGNLVSQGAIPTGLPPNELLALPDPVSDAVTLEGELVLGSPTPNPSNGPVIVNWRGPGAGMPVALEVFDGGGRRIRKPSQGSAEPVLRWDGCDSAGDPVPAGVYYLRAVSGQGASATRSVCILR